MKCIGGLTNELSRRGEPPGARHCGVAFTAGRQFGLRYFLPRRDNFRHLLPQSLYRNDTPIGAVRFPPIRRHAWLTSVKWSGFGANDLLRGCAAAPPKQES